MNQKDKTNWTIGIVVGVLVIAIIIYVIYQSNQTNTNYSSNNPGAGQTLPGPTATSSPATSTPPSTTTTKKLSYAQAILAYPERFQFSNTCQGTPATIAVRKNTPVMLDNRNSYSITVKADSDTFKLAGYGYDVFYPQVIENLAVTCNGKNSVTLNVEP